MALKYYKITKPSQFASFSLTRNSLRQLVFRLAQLFWQVVDQLGEQLVVQFQLIRPGGFVEAGDGVELFFREVQACPVQLFVSWADAERLVHTGCFAFDAVNDPSQHAHVFAVTCLDEFAGGGFVRRQLVQIVVES
jgi:hypothetical protein